LAELQPAPASQAVTAQDLAARLRDALASNTIGGRDAAAERWQSASAEMESAQTAWKRLGPLAGEDGRALAQRFESASQRFLALRPKGERPRGEERRPERPRRDGPRRDGPRRDGPRRDGPRPDRGPRR
jgi:hypothetical protein